MEYSLGFEAEVVVVVAGAAAVVVFEECTGAELEVGEPRVQGVQDWQMNQSQRL